MDGPSIILPPLLCTQVPSIFKLIVAYDGTAYGGWQKQKAARSVIQSLEDTFLRTFKIKARFLGASRTDAGVHAIGQTVRCVTPLSLPAEVVAKVLNDNLPPDIYIRKMVAIGEDFHPWYNVLYKTYYYHLFTKKPLPFVARYGWYYYKAFDLKKCEAAFAQFVGTHDFRSFCSAEDKREDTVRTVEAITIRYFSRVGAYRICIKGHSFLRHMIRRIVGASIQIASDPNYSVDYIGRVLLEKNPKQRLFNAPAQGLLLRSITYKPKD